MFDKNTEEILHKLIWLERSLVLLDERIANTPWYEKLWDRVLRSDWYHKLWNTFRSSAPTAREDNECN